MRSRFLGMLSSSAPVSRDRFHSHWRGFSVIATERVGVLGRVFMSVGDENVTFGDGVGVNEEGRCSWASPSTTWSENLPGFVWALRTLQVSQGFLVSECVTPLYAVLPAPALPAGRGLGRSTHLHELSHRCSAQSSHRRAVLDPRASRARDTKKKPAGLYCRDAVSLRAHVSPCRLSLLLLRWCDVPSCNGAADAGADPEGRTGANG
jgi:hypothetical protein